MGKFSIAKLVISMKTTNFQLNQFLFINIRKYPAGCLTMPQHKIYNTPKKRDFLRGLKYELSKYQNIEYL